MKVSAWSSWAEFSAVFHQLISGDAEQRTRGVERVETWRTRGRMPVAVDITGSFVEIMLNDPFFNSSTAAPRKDHELRLMYAMAVVRLVNGIVDGGQRRTNAGTILSRAQGLEWPQWFVDLRHEASHQKLPPLPLLRLAAQEAVWLLVERFWRPQIAQLEERGGKSIGPAQGQAGRALERARGTRTLDRRLRGLAHAAAAAGNAMPGVKSKRKRKRASGVEVPGVASGQALSSEEAAALATAAAEAAAAEAESAACHLALLAPDEGRLLSRTFATLLSVDPSRDARGMRAVYLLCEHCSDNFALRLARELLTRALCWPEVKLEAAADNCPGLRNISDSSMGLSAEPSSDQALTDSAEPDLMIRWLEVLLAPPAAEAMAVAVAGRQRFFDAVAGLGPVLRRASLDRMVGGSDCDPSCAQRVWQVLHVTGADAGAAHFADLCGMVAGQEPVPSGSGANFMVVSSASVRQAGSSLTTKSLDEVEEFLLREPKKSRFGTEAAFNPVLREPWTALGTVLDPATLAIRCRPELEPDGLPEGAVGRWLGWAASEVDEGLAKKDLGAAGSAAWDTEGRRRAPASATSAPVQRVAAAVPGKGPSGFVAVPKSGGAKPASLTGHSPPAPKTVVAAAPESGSSEVAVAFAYAELDALELQPAISELEFRQRAAALLRDLKPLGS
ncbi:unnamed protein product [Polarella glacialis]|uniref:Uncharacterized protein n=1 Tax=Polarella glacialis TaxID=89957 RepID=A0A813H101_POLGL|nr:unnamed protein product [Polarella glacialis]